MQYSSRIDSADALRGFSILGIVLLHSIEHFNFYSYPEITSEWLRFWDKAIWDSLFFTFGGKAYGIFALLFGFSFFIQDNNRLKKGYDFRPRFFWRLILLFIWGNINAVFFTGEVLVLFSLMGLVLILTARLSNKVVFIIAILFLLQPMEWGKLFYAIANPDLPVPQKLSSYYFGEAFKIQQSGNFIETARMNLWEGQLASLTWAWENGRMFQTSAFFMLGMLIGRMRLFVNTAENILFWTKAIPITIICFFPLKGLTEMLPAFIENKAILIPAVLITSSLAKFAFMGFMAALFMAAYHKTRFHRLLVKLIPYGKMSLTSYITQSVIGSALFYNWGFGLHDKLGITASFFVGILIFLVQYAFACWWFKRYKQGPLEYIWKKATWIGSKSS